MTMDIFKKQPYLMEAERFSGCAPKKSIRIVKISVLSAQLCMLLDGAIRFALFFLFHA